MACGGSGTSNSLGAVVIPGAGTVYFHSYRLSGACGTLAAENGVLVASDGRSRRLPAPVRGDDMTISGDGWTFKAAAGWVIREGARKGDYEVVKVDVSKSLARQVAAFAQPARTAAASARPGR
jgi:hypothetical protein